MDAKAQLKELALLLLKSSHDEYAALYKEYSETETPGKKKWLESIGEPDNASDLEDLFEGVNELATSDEVSPEELQWLIKRCVKLTNTLRSYLSSQYHALARNDDGIQPQTVQAKLEEVSLNFENVMNYVAMGVITQEEVATTVPTEHRNVRAKADGTPQTKFSYNPPGKVRIVDPNKSTGGIRSNNKKYKLVVDGVVVENSSGKIGDALRTAKLGTIQEVGRKFEEVHGKNGWSPKFFGIGVEIDGRKVTLVEA